MAFTVIYDACVLYPAPLRDLLIRIAQTGVVRAKWSDDILDECFRSILNDRPDLNEAALSRTRALMTMAVRDVMVSGYADLLENLHLPDPDDRHVLAAAIRSGAQSIVTWNLKDFPSDRLEEYGVEVVDPDDFVLSQTDLRPGIIAVVVTQQAAALKNPTRTTNEMLDVLHAQGLVRSVARLREVLS